MKKTLLLLSGGMDSVALFYWLKSDNAEMECLYFDYGQNHCQRERGFAEKHCLDAGVRFHVKTLPSLEGSLLTADSVGTWVVPSRNSIFLSHAANFAESHGFAYIAYACNSDDSDGFPDCRPEWVGAFNQQLAFAEMKCRVVTPFIQHTKLGIVWESRRIQAPIERSWSCYRHGIEPCGECPACEKRTEAFK